MQYQIYATFVLLCKRKIRGLSSPLTLSLYHSVQVPEWRSCTSLPLNFEHKPKSQTRKV